ncbi:MAG: hypothetical protein JRE38_09105 [Deltaproteobacteria bacterium]|nr:hypothetical protein [Deltaproteobacteria bacterium]MBW2691759.1 hypothetical protein [Deltaproteobacteria bacterium]
MFEYDIALHRLASIPSIRLQVFATALVAAAVLILGGCDPRGTGPDVEAADANSLDAIAEAYVKLGLALGNHDPDYVDAYLGPPEWREEAEHANPSPSEIRKRATQLIDALGAEPPPDTDEMTRLRQHALRKNIEALATRVEMLGGKNLSFDQESSALFDAVAPIKSESEFQVILDELAQLLPGEGSLFDRYEAFRKQFEIPPDRLDAVFQAAITECRARTMRFISLPKQESFEVEYVTEKPWNAYNWYKGNYHSLIQVNTSLPVHIGDAVGLACHEGYPGHHVNNILWERDLLHGRGWVEFSLYPLFGPQSVINEGSAEYGIRMAFPGEERIAFEREKLFPLAGLDPARVEEYHQVRDLVQELDYVRNEAARRYLDGEFDKQQTIHWLERYALISAPRAERNVQFIEKYRSYVINYNLGKDLVRHYIEASGGAAPPIERRWQAFERLLASPLTPSDLTLSDQNGGSGRPER